LVSGGQQPDSLFNGAVNVANGASNVANGASGVTGASILPGTTRGLDLSAGGSLHT
jgi:hypothetical protein